jgi:hypothetical protein
MVEYFVSFMVCILLLACFVYCIWKTHKKQVSKYATTFRRKQRGSKLATSFILAFGSLTASLLASIFGLLGEAQLEARVVGIDPLQFFSEGMFELHPESFDWLQYCFIFLERFLFGLFLFVVSPMWVTAATYAIGGVSATHAASRRRRLILFMRIVFVIFAPLSTIIVLAMMRAEDSIFRMLIGIVATGFGWEVLLSMALLALACWMRSIAKSSAPPEESMLRKRVREIYCCLSFVCVCILLRNIGTAIVLVASVQTKQAVERLRELIDDLYAPGGITDLIASIPDLLALMNTIKGLIWPGYLLMSISGFVACFSVFYDMMRVARHNALFVRQARASREDDLTVLHEGGPGTLDITDGYPPHKIGIAPSAPRPDWLPSSGKGQAHVEPTHWSLSIANYLRLVQFCRGTSTWVAIANAKGGEEKITMYDVNKHFVKPWTIGTGCSLAVLLSGDEPQPAELMLSHAWAGSVVQTFHGIETLLSMHKLPSEARVFFCTFCLYQPEDGHADGLSVNDQVELQPFAKIIESRPQYGMFVIHTTLSEVYDRLWVVHEADTAEAASISVNGIFDVNCWEQPRWCSRKNSIRTQEGKCGVEADREFIDKLVRARGGYARLDAFISKFRKRMDDALNQALEFDEVMGLLVSEDLCRRGPGREGLMKDRSRLLEVDIMGAVGCEMSAPDGQVAASSTV